MIKADVMNKLTTIMQELFENSSLVVTEETSGDDVDEWDSLTHIGLIDSIEKEFKVKFGLGELMKLKNVGQMADLIIKKTA
jgi:acyl carrier protein